MDYALQTDRLCKTYRHYHALDGLTMNVPCGSIYGFVGRNGAEKTTLIRLICGLQKLTSGRFTLDGVHSTERDILKIRRRMGAVVETPSIYLGMTAEDNLKQQYRILCLPSYDGLRELFELIRANYQRLFKSRLFWGGFCTLFCINILPVKLND